MSKAIKVVFFKGTGFVSKAIMSVTGSEVSHVALLLDDGKEEPWFFETHMGKNAAYVPARKYKDSETITFKIIPRKKDFFDIVQKLCDAYQFAPYSPWDITTNAATSWLAPGIRKGIVSFLGGKRFMICSELTARILYEADKEQFFDLQRYEGMTPGDLLVSCKFNNEYFRLEQDEKNEKRN